MVNTIRQRLAIVINRNPDLKNSLLMLMDYFHEYKQIFVGIFTRNPAYFKHIFNSKVIAKPGTLGFSGGAFNPGTIILDDNKILLLAKSQILPWYKARGKNKKYFLKGSPVGFILDRDSLKTKENFVVKDFNNFPVTDDYAIEDFRMFNWKAKKIINHSWIVKAKTSGIINQQSVKSALSVFEEENNSIKFCAFPKVDFPVQDIEKNWVYKENDEKLLLFYSVNPYRVLSLEEEESFSFRTIINQEFSDKMINPGGFGTMVSFSTNPVDFDDRYWLVIIHQIKYKFTGRCYFHWAVLIDKATLLPVKITSKPIFSGMGARGRVPGYRYISSVLKTDDEILFFAGEGDIFVTVTKKKIKEIENLLVEI